MDKNAWKISDIMLFMKHFTSKTQKTGEVGEKLAKKFLIKRGFKVLETNYTKKFGEIDIVAKEDRVYHFIEVKSVSCDLSAQAGNLKLVTQETLSVRPEENMHPKKIEKFVRTVQYYLVEKGVSDETPYQIDLALVYIDKVKKQGRVSLMENII